MYCDLWPKSSKIEQQTGLLYGTLITPNLVLGWIKQFETKMPRTAALYVIIDLTFIVDLKSDIFEDI